ncbi:MAG: EAL domain-containing protein [Rubrivivax sp.]
MSDCGAPDGLALLDALPDAAWLVDLAGLRVRAANAAAARLFGCARDALVGCAADALVASPEDAAYWAAAAGGEPGELASEAALVLAGAPGAAHGDGRPSESAAARVLHASRSIRLVPGAAGGTVHALVVVRDRSAEQCADDERELRLAELQATLESAADGLLVTDLRGAIRAFNRRFGRMWGLPLELLQQRDDAAIDAWMRRQMPDEAAYARRVEALRDAPLVPAGDRLELVDGRVYERVTRPLWCSGRPQGRVWAFRDLTEKIAAAHRIETLERLDALTALPNRRGFYERAEAVAQTQRRSGAGFALLLVDLDRFRHVNDSLGHEVGDQVLQDTATRIGGCLREGDMLARVGGDQFAVLLAPADAAAAEATARRILNVVAQPSSVDGAHFTLTCSVGIALAPSHGRSADELARHAEAAMRAVKASGRAGVRLHQRRAEADGRSDMRLEHAMRQALVSGRFRLQYQPQVRLADGLLVGAEALLRWRDPELGEVAPQRFIPVAEDSGFIVPIGDWVLAQAVRQAALWRERGHALPIAINVSALQFQQPHFVERVSSVLAVAGLEPQLLELELTESILLHDADEALARLQALARLGVRLSIDDFGTGYSSLVYLKRFPIDKLKIDRCFVQGLPGDAGDCGIVQAILQMARALGMRAIAEGVETEAQRAYLQAAGCEEFQGWLYAPALDPLSFEQRLVGAAPERRTLPRMRLVSG